MELPQALVLRDVAENLVGDCEGAQCDAQQCSMCEEVTQGVVHQAKHLEILWRKRANDRQEGRELGLPVVGQYKFPYMNASRIIADGMLQALKQRVARLPHEADNACVQDGQVCYCAKIEAPVIFHGQCARLQCYDQCRGSLLDQTYME